MKPISTRTFRSMRRVGRVFAAGATLLLILTVWIVVADQRRSWMVFQWNWRNRIEPWMADAKDHQRGRDASDRRSAVAPLRIHSIEPPDLTWDRHFAEVPRIDRCATCHAGIAATEAERDGTPAWRFPEAVAGTVEGPLAAAMEHRHPRPAWVAPCRMELRVAIDGTAESGPLAHGLTLVDRSALGQPAATVAAVLLDSPAARAGLEPGDVIATIDDEPVTSLTDVERLWRVARPGLSRVAIQRGLPHPHTSHPRLDLFVGATSPHPVETFGCTICHGGDGAALDFARASHRPTASRQEASWQSTHGWRRLESSEEPMRPMRFIESACLACHADPIVLEDARPDAAPQLTLGYRLIRESGCFGCHAFASPNVEHLTAGDLLRWEGDLTPSGRAVDADAPRLANVGTSLRHVGTKLGRDWLRAWIAEPSAVRPDTRMPSFYGIDDHLTGPTREESRALEAVEIEAITAYLLARSQAPPASTERLWSQEHRALIAEGTPPNSPRVAAGRNAFLVAGCAACHQTPDHREPGVTKGPSLNDLGTKLDSPIGRRWLLEWLETPSRHDSRTTMPTPIWPEGPEGTTALDIASYLLSLETTIQPPGDMTVEALNQMARFLQVENVSSARADARAVQERLIAVGEAMVRHRGCHACHDIPGCEKTPAIGPTLADWGRKRPALLGFEQVHAYLQTPAQQAVLAEAHDPDGDFFVDLVRHETREGFLWQKLRAPRGFDYSVADSKPYVERLTMGQFHFTPAEREAIMTFLLGLTTRRSPRATEADHRARVVARGRELIAYHGCDQCHVTDPARWTFRYDPETWRNPRATNEFDFACFHPTVEEEILSRVVDRAGFGLAQVAGRPVLAADGRWLSREDDEDDVVVAFTLEKPTVIQGHLWEVGGQDVPIAGRRIIHQQPQRGGAFATRLYLHLQRERGELLTERWGECPPSLVDVGRRLRPEWIADYLRHTTALRPAVVSPMPRYGLTDDEIASLVGYFAIRDNQTLFPMRSALTAEKVSPQRAARWDAAYRLLIDRTTFCAKCHDVGDWTSAQSEETTLAPNLAFVQGRLREEYLRRWIAAPRTVLPYTAMPAHFPPDGPPVGQELLPGSSVEQIDALIDLLLHWDVFETRRRVSPSTLHEGNDAP